MARLLGDRSLANAGSDSVRGLVEERFSLLVQGILDEAAASDDVIDRDSALTFVEDRVHFLTPLLEPNQASRLRQALQDKIETW